MEKGRFLFTNTTRTLRSVTLRQPNQHNNARRWRSAASGPGLKPFWTTGRVLLLTAFTGSLTYIVGISDALSHGREGISQRPIYASRRQLEKAICELQSQLGEDSVSTDDEDLHNHGFSEWSSYNIDKLPVAVAYPKSTEEVSGIAKVCSKYKVPMVPYSGGSSLEANFSAPYGGISIDLAHMDKIVELRADDLDVTVQPAVGWMFLNDKIKDTGLFFPVDPGPSAMIGGMVGTSCSGTNAVRYGTMRDWVINMTVVLADGTVIKTKQRPRKTAAGYSLNHLFVGSEGTLGIVTEITLKLAPIPQHTSVAVVTFPTLHDAAATAQSVIRAGIPVGAMEIMDEVSMSVINRVGRTNRQWAEKPSLFFKFVGTQSAVAENAAQVKAISQSQKSKSFEIASNEVDAANLWSARKENLWSMLSLRRPDTGDAVWPTDYAVPISRLPDLIAASKSSLEKNEIFATCLGHIGDGNFHETILYDASDPRVKAKVVEHVKRVTAAALAMEGTCTGEHGVGMSKKDDLVKELGQETIDVMRKVKKALDPDGLMNPGKIFD